MLLTFSLDAHSRLCVWSLPALLDRVSSQQRVNNRVNGLLKVLNEDRVPGHYSLFYYIYVPENKMEKEQLPCSIKGTLESSGRKMKIQEDN